ncbi:tRNA pseudouridine(13) synthase TruD [Candidatus Bathyarchaeota archaeon]|nr:tRNA pseudouridine(13) synthase TruD [Candidatus Bathyarchaeota archaeon]
MLPKPVIDTRLPYITEKIPGIGGSIKIEPEYFQVTEIPSYQPIGHGDHIYINLTKRMKTTREIQIKLSQILNIKIEDIGHAGLKDKFAVTTQTFSILNKNKMEPKDIIEIISEGLEEKINWWNLHPKKLRSGHLKGNSFKIMITNIDINQDEIQKRIDAIIEKINYEGIPNFYGTQRIGSRGNNALKGYEIIKGKYFEKNRWLKRYLVSSYLSYLCNQYLTERMKRGLFSKIINGDIAKKHETGGIFWVDDILVDQMRFDAKEISFTSPIYGYKMLEVKNDAKILEDDILGHSGITKEELRKSQIIGTRRLGRLLPKIKAIFVSEGLQLNFDLPSGSYATVILREFMKNDEKSEFIEEDSDLDDDEN